jgi:hypothetical protein
MLADDREEDVGSFDRLANRFAKVDAGLDGVDVHEDLLLREARLTFDPRAERIPEPADMTGGVVAAIVDEDAKGRVCARSAGLRFWFAVRAAFNHAVRLRGPQTIPFSGIPSRHP